ncbi:MAG: glycosyltransferase [Rhodococcus sp.]|nr:glycosyltransferase [Rhodococcus sp. (in: high G+C Gram-positive bacteria)]
MTPGSSARANSAAAASVAAGTSIAVAGAVVAAVNRATLPRLTPGAQVAESVAVVVPARNEARRIADVVGDLRAQRGVPRLTVHIVDDASTDGTGEVARDAAGGDSRFTVVRSEDGPPAGWTGKAAACSFAFRERGGLPSDGVVVFVDADVRLGPDAIASAVNLLRHSGAALVSPWPRQVAGSLLERLVQPLLFWSWFSSLPVAVSHRSSRPSMVVACGQFLVVDGQAYAEAGGHAAVAGSATDDLDLARVLRRAGARTMVAAAAPHVSCRMYTGDAALVRGYTRWLWSAFGSPLGAGVVVAVYTLGYLVPPVAAITGSGRLRAWGLAGAAAAVTSRAVAAGTERGGRPTTGDAASAIAHPASVVVFAALTAMSLRLRRSGGARWKGRVLP